MSDDHPVERRRQYDRDAPVTNGGTETGVTQISWSAARLA